MIGLILFITFRIWLKSIFMYKNYYMYALNNSKNSKNGTRRFYYLFYNKTEFVLDGRVETRL